MVFCTRNEKRLERVTLEVNETKKESIWSNVTYIYSRRIILCCLMPKSLGVMEGQRRLSTRNGHRRCVRLGTAKTTCAMYATPFGFSFRTETYTKQEPEKSIRLLIKISRGSNKAHYI